MDKLHILALWEVDGCTVVIQGSEYSIVCHHVNPNFIVEDSQNLIRVKIEVIFVKFCFCVLKLESMVVL